MDENGVFLEFFLCVLATWRVTNLLANEDGPWDAVVRLRSRAGAGFWGSLMDCFYCLSLWVAIPFAFLAAETGKERFLLWLALSAGAIMLERITNRGHGNTPPPARYFEDKED